MEFAGAVTEPQQTTEETPGSGGPEEIEAVADLRALPQTRQRRLIAELVRAGRNDAEIGERYALSQWQVRNLRYRLGLKKDRGGHVRTRVHGRRNTGLERELAEAATRVAAGPADRLPALPAPGEEERMGIRLAGRFAAAEAGRRISALGGVLAASEGRYEVRLSIRQIDALGQ